MLHRSLIRNVSILATCQAFFFMANTIQITTSALVGLQIAPSPALATLPLAAQFVGNMLATMPASLLMARIGRRLGLLLGSLFGVLSGLLATWAVVQASYPLFMTAGLLYGVFGAFSQYFRFTAADAADASDVRDKVAARARAIALVMAGGLVAAVLGPELAKATQDLLPPFVFAGCYLMIATVAFCCGVALSFLDLPRKITTASDAPARPLLEIVRRPEAITAFAAALVAYVTMNMLMTATPLAMLACGYAFADSAMVIQWHVVGMFAPSFVTGSLITRHGEGRVMAAGALALIGCVAVNLAGESVGSFWLALVLLGVGWNFLFVGATSLLTTVYLPVEKAKTQGLNDLLVFGTVAATAFSSGMLHHRLGWHGLNLAVLPALVLALLGAVMLARARRPTRP